MTVIRILPDTVADQIAAGEVVERPASVVKELVENALDAGATSITVALEGGGRTLVRVSDNGVGMDAEDAALALQRHATSKIQTAPDLVGVGTYGFRGEALPAIASVAHLELETAHRDGDGTGVRITVRGGTVEGTEVLARAPGTVVAVHNLFYNTPARRKFLRSQRSETRAAVDAVVGLAMGRLDVAFELTSDGRTLVDAPVAEAPIDRIASLFGRSTADQLVGVAGGTDAVRVQGFVQRPVHARPAGRKALLFVNGRPIRDPFLVRAAEAGYRATLPVGHRPTVILGIEVAGDAVDVNVHPAKLEVRFHERRAVEHAVEVAVREALGPLEASASLGGDASGWASGVAEPGGAWAPPSWTSPRGDAPEQQASFFDPTTVPSAGVGSVLQVYRTYLIYERDDGVWIVDQHAAHERVLYERAMQALEGEGAAAQQLLLPLTLELESPELDAVESHGDMLRRVGYLVEPFGGRTVAVQAVPNPHPRFDAQRCLEELVTDLARDRFGAVPNRLERFAATYACRAAVKAGQAMDASEMRALIEQLMACVLPPHDVHGRPAMVSVSRDELERRFGRA